MGDQLRTPAVGKIRRRRVVYAYVVFLQPAVCGATLLRFGLDSSSNQDGGSVTAWGLRRVVIEGDLFLPYLLFLGVVALASGRTFYICFVSPLKMAFAGIDCAGRKVKV